MGFLMLLIPMLVFVITIPLARNLRVGLKKVYLFLGGFIVFAGSGTSLYFAMFGGDQGGISAYFFQIAVLSAYVILSLVILVIAFFTPSHTKENSADT